MDCQSTADTPAHRLQTRLSELAASLETDPQALGLLALGSVGAQMQRLDAWSDLDFFVIVTPEAKARYIADLSWLRRAHPLLWHFQNTVDGQKALMVDGVLCEFAVFTIDELTRAVYTPGRWVWRRDSVDAKLAQPLRSLPAPPGDPWLVGEALSNLMVGLMRHARGERLAAMRMVQVYALDRVLELAAKRATPNGHAPIDPFNPDRRIERRCPELVPNLDVWAGGYERTVPAARAVLGWLRTYYAVPEAVANHIEALAQASEQRADRR
jgi:hypothetical protein